MMNKNILKNTIIAGALSTMMVVPSLAQNINVVPISIKEGEVIPISYKMDHWAQIHKEKLLSTYDVEAIFKDKDLNAPITVEDFKNLIQLSISQEYDNVPDGVTRETIVYELTKIWAEKTGRNLETVPVIKMLIYQDTDQIDIKYNHGVMVAYMLDIAKGRETRKFDPKAFVTYGELAALVNNTDKAIQKELRSNPPSIAPGKFETRGTYEVKEDKVIFDFEIISHYTEPKELKLGSGQQFELTITDEKGEEVYRYSDGKFFTLALLYKELNPGEILKWQDEWDMTNKEGKKLESGKYKAEIKILAIFEEGEEKIEESQLTTVMEFNL